MEAARRLVGSDIELVGSNVYPHFTKDAWDAWLTGLDVLPEKGIRADLEDGYWAHKDGLSAEYGFEPATELDQFMTHIEEGKRRLERVVGTTLMALDVFDISPLVRLPDYAAVINMGCQPDWLALPDGRMRKRTVTPRIRQLPVRESGGHIHVSLPPPFLDSPVLMTQFVGELDDSVFPLLPMDLQSREPTWYRRRRVFRPTTYGIEYRTLGAEALFGPVTELIMTQVFNLADRAWEV